MRLHLPLPATYETSTSPDGTLRAQLPSGATLTVPPLRPIPEDIWYWASSAQEVDLPAGAHTRQVRVQEARTALGWTISIVEKDTIAADGQVLDHRLHVVHVFHEYGTVLSLRGTQGFEADRDELLEIIAAGRPDFSSKQVVSIYQLFA